jgi:hypothetical protein
VRLERRPAQRSEKFTLRGGVGLVVAAQRRGRVPGDRLDRDAARLVPRGAASDAVGHQQQCGEALAAQREGLGRGEARPMDQHLPMDRREEEVVLVLSADEAAVREAEEVELVVPGPVPELHGDRGGPEVAGSHRGASGGRRWRAVERSVEGDMP